MVKVENIYYDFNATVFNVSALPELAKLIDFMNLNPTVKIELGSHTDSRGKNEYNEKLSQQRANKVVLFLHLEGIDKNRIVAKGYGENLLLNGCADGIDCDEEKHKANRRTEFKILSY